MSNNTRYPSRGRARIGVLVPFTNSNLEPDMTLMSPPGFSIHVARMGGYDADQIPDAEQMHGLGGADLDDPLRLLSGVKPDVILYGCTSATLTHGPEFDRALAQRIRAQSGAATVTAAGAITAALRAIGAKRIGFASPYVAGINDLAVAFLSQYGMETLRRSEPAAPLDNDGQGALSPHDVYDLACKADHPEANAIVLSCTDMRSVETIARLEDDLGKPVISSNQAMLYQACLALAYPDPIPGFGQLLERQR